MWQCLSPSSFPSPSPASKLFLLPDLQRSWTSFEKTARWVMDFDGFWHQIAVTLCIVSILYKRTTQKNPQRQTAFSEHPILTTPLDLQGIHKNPRNLSKSEEAKAADLRKGRMPTRNKVLGFDLATWLRTPESRPNVENVDSRYVESTVVQYESKNESGAMKRSPMIIAIIEKSQMIQMIQIQKDRRSVVPNMLTIRIRYTRPALPLRTAWAWTCQVQLYDAVSLSTFMFISFSLI